MLNTLQPVTEAVRALTTLQSTLHAAQDMTPYCGSHTW
jgi:hypothetical protein